jgi:hypothetical protein
VINISIQVKLSAKSQAVTLKNLSKEQAHEITRLLTGIEGINRITVEWDEPVNETPQYTRDTETLSDDGPTKIEYPDQPCAIVSHPETTDQSEPPTAPGSNPLISTPRLLEIKRIPRKALGPYIDINIHNMGYHDQSPSRDVAICYGTTKVYTTWDDLAKLPFPVPAEAIFELNTLKQTAVKHFRKWMQQQANQAVQTEPTAKPKSQNPEDDLDAPYRQQLPPGMIDTGTASIDSSKHEGPMPE